MFLQIGFNARLFPNNWRPVREEIRFAAAQGFQAIQLPGPEGGLDAARLGDSFEVVAAALQAAGLVAVMEMVMRVNTEGYTASGASPLDILRANLPAITALGCRCVHWHFVLEGEEDPVELAKIAQVTLDRLEESFIPSCREGVTLAAQHGFMLGFEHNEPELRLLAVPASCRTLLQAVPGLKFVWDFNHTAPQHVPEFKALIPAMSMLHISDTPLPETNHHLPLGLGNVDLADYCRALREGGFHGPAVLEIGGLPKSGGYNRDTDEALVDSLRRLRTATS